MRIDTRRGYTVQRRHRLMDKTEHLHLAAVPARLKACFACLASVQLVDMLMEPFSAASEHLKARPAATSTLLTHVGGGTLTHRPLLQGRVCTFYRQPERSHTRHPESQDAVL